MDRIIFSNRITGKTLLYFVFLLAAGGAILFFIEGGENRMWIIGGTLGSILLVVALFWYSLHFSSRPLIAELTLRGGTLQAELAHMLGKGKKMELPIPPESDWGWYSQKADSKSFERVGIITFKSGGTTYQMSLNDAKVVDEVELRKLAPKTIDEMIASKVIIHKPAEA